MIIKNILIKYDNHEMRIEVSDVDMKPEKKEKITSKVLDECLEQLIKDDNFRILCNLRRA